MLELKNISLSVEDEFTNNAQKEILRDISLTVESGKFVVITGPNGGGKSTLAKMIAGILKPTSARSSLTARTLPTSASPNVRIEASAMPFSSRSVSRASRCATSLSWLPAPHR